MTAGNNQGSRIKRYAIFILLFLFFNQAYTQVNDTLIQEPAHSPKKAALMSASLPGLGQIYNKKYWKVPIIYGVGGYLFYRFQYSAERYQEYEEAYIDMQNGKIDQFENRTNPKDVQQVRNIYRRNRDLYIIMMSGLYLANILDASVDAYLFDFEVTENLSMSLEPTSFRTELSSSPMVGLKCSFSF